ncbi:dihydroorotate dehydrogenase-like protein [bacterium]|nr:MAG: dihydroorotate dehydrogenase-like protein [bacterium]
MDLSTTYMGLKLKNPLVPSASPLSTKLETAKKLEDNGASAIVMYSLFEEQITREAKALDHTLTTYSEAYAEALNYFPEPEEFSNIHAEEYLEQIYKLKNSLDIPVIASLNGVSSGGWMNFAKLIQQAGADGLELNVYYLATDPAMDSKQVEENYLDDIRAVKHATTLPIAVKVGPYFSAFANMAVRMAAAGADALVLFNRFYQPDINLSDLTVEPSLQFSSEFEKRLPMRWLAILYGQVKASLAATTGVHTADDAIKMILCGADVTMMASTLLKHGPHRLQNILDGIEQWMTDYEYESIEQMKGSMSHQNVAEPAAYERANYLRILQGYKI